jgi:hypothetical protein
MALFNITVKQSITSNGIRLEKGMSVQVASRYSNPVLSNGGHEVQDAFLRVHGIDLKRACKLSTQYLDVVKVN